MNSTLTDFLERKLRLVGGEVCGDWYRVKCPFHSDNDPSFGVELKAPYRYNCFGCGAGGDLVGLTAKILDIKFEAARKQVLNLRVQNLSSLSAEWAEWEAEFVPLHPAHLPFYQQSLELPVARKYLRSRRISLAIAQTFKLGYCRNRKAIVVPLQEPYSGQLGGLFFRGVRGSFKHIEGAKRRLVFASPNIRTADTVIVVEGWADAIRAYQYRAIIGAPSAAVVSLQQTRATSYIRRFLLDYSTIIWGLDDDKAGHIGLEKNSAGLKLRQYVLEFDGGDIGKSSEFAVHPLTDISAPELPARLR